MSLPALHSDPTSPAGLSTSVLFLSPGGALGAAVCAALAVFPRLALAGPDVRAVRTAADEVRRVRALRGDATSPLVLPAGAPGAHVAAASARHGGLDALVVQLDAPPTGALADALDAMPEGTRSVIVAPNGPPGLGDAVAAFVAASASARPASHLCGVVAMHAPRLGWAPPAGPEAYTGVAHAVASLLDAEGAAGTTLRVPVRAHVRHVA